MQRIKAEIVLWTAGFVLLTLVINAPLLPLFLRVSGLSKGQCMMPCMPFLHPSLQNGGCKAFSMVALVCRPHDNALR
jgi:hypothetical protein